MALGAPQILFALWLVPISGLVLFIAHRQRRQAALRFANAGMVERLMPTTSMTRHWVRATMTMLAVGFLVFAAARPQFGVTIEKVAARGVDLFVLLDVSRSMLAEDVVPNRLERAKSDILDLLPRLEGDRVGLIAFAGAPVELVPLTTDQAFFRMALEDVTPDSAPRGGSLIGDAIRRAMEALEERRDRDQVIVLISDGDDHESYPMEAAEQAAERGIRVIAIGLGDTGDGARIPERREDGTLSYKQQADGQEVWSKLNETLLEKIAMKTSGAWIPARTRAYDLGQLYEDHLSSLTRGEFQSEHRRRLREQYQLFAAIGLLFLLVEKIIPGSIRLTDASRNVQGTV
jgi:Ca-activated chloride channel family protein